MKIVYLVISFLLKSIYLYRKYIDKNKKIVYNTIESDTTKKERRKK